MGGTKVSLRVFSLICRPLSSRRIQIGKSTLCHSSSRYFTDAISRGIRITLVHRAGTLTCRVVFIKSCLVAQNPNPGWINPIRHCWPVLRRRSSSATGYRRSAHSYAFYVTGASQASLQLAGSLLFSNVNTPPQMH